APGTERGANGDFTLAGGVAREKKTGDVCAGNQKDQSDGADKHDERGTHIADENVLQRFELHAKASVRFWKLGGEVSGNGAGNHRSACVRIGMSVERTPTTVRDLPSSEMDLPITLGSPPKRASPKWRLGITGL